MFVLMYVQVNADDTVIYVHDKTKEKVAQILSIAMTKKFDWFIQCCLTLNVRKSACMYFTIKKKEEVQTNILVNGEQLQIVPDLKYLGVILDSHLTFEKHVRTSTSTKKCKIYTESTFNRSLQESFWILWYFLISLIVLAHGRKQENLLLDLYILCINML